MYKNNIYISTYFKEYVIKITIDNNDWPAVNQRENTRSTRDLCGHQGDIYPDSQNPIYFTPKPPPNDFFWVAEEILDEGGYPFLNF
jgi:hypothetical protein